MFSFFRNMMDIISPECPTCGGPCKYQKNEQKNYVCLEDGGEEKLICKSCANFFQTVNDMKKGK